MSSENISVSLSRLALAKAIKTPDADEEESEPWAKSVIFHQSHISPGMLENVMNPQQQRRPQQQHPRYRQQQQQQQQHKSYQHQQHQEHRSHRQSRQLLEQPHSNTRRDRTNYQQANATRPTSSYGIPSSSSVNYLGQALVDQQPRRTASPQTMNVVNPRQQQQQQQQKRQTRYVPSDDEEEEEEDDGSDDASSQSSIPVIKTTHLGQNTSISPPTENKPIERSPSNDRGTTLPTKKNIPVPSDDDESESELGDDSTSMADSQDETSRGVKTKAIFNEWTVPLVEKEESQEDEHMKARRMSTLRQLERGPSLHKRSRSDGAMEKIYTTDVAIDNGLLPGDDMQPLQEAQGDGIEQWRQTVLNAVDSIGTTTLSSPAPESANGHTAPSSSSSLIDNGLSSVSSNTMDPMASATTPPVAGDKTLGTRGRRTTLGEMDMMYYMQQQQLQMLQQQQLAQMQYQQAAWQVAQQQMIQVQAQQQQQQQQHMMMAAPMDHQQNRRNKVKSVSAMDMMMQIEQEKEAKATALRKPKRIDPSKAHIDGLLGKVKDQGKHNISFQQQTIKDRADRMAGRSTPRNDHHKQYQHHHQQQSYSRQSMMTPEARLQTPMMMLGNPSDPYLLQQQQWQRPQQMSRSESSPGLQQPYMYRQSMALNSTPGLVSPSYSDSLAAPPPMMTASRSTGRPASVMRPQSSWGNF
ncbi:hypothetical protein BC941DRAFT_443973 [Chlamydoabsidia padenii]|nr:hypothetical protein BC941DRAFT_443973 [Chlamydoabsidia padenii]